MISIITGTLNRLELLKRVISNTVGRSNKLELILMDGGSTDGTVEYVKELNNPQIKLIEIGGRSSYPHFMNLGIKNSTYEWVCQWNDDILLMNDWEDVFNVLNEKTDAYIFDWTRGTLENFETSDKNVDPNRFNSYWIYFNHCMNFGIYRKEIFRKIGMYDSQFKYYECDHDMTLRCSSFGYNVVNCHNIKVMEIITDKRSIEYGNEYEVTRNNYLYYQTGNLPTTIELLK
jgi:glycosyltransferase involved in cell wall biosynthesis